MMVQPNKTMQTAGRLRRPPLIVGVGHIVKRAGPSLVFGN